MKKKARVINIEKGIYKKGIGNPLPTIIYSICYFGYDKTKSKKKQHKT